MQLLSPAHRLLNLCRLVTRPALESWKASHFWWKVGHSPALIFCTIDFVQVLPLSLQFLLGCILAFTSCKIASQNGANDLEQLYWAWYPYKPRSIWNIRGRRLRFPYWCRNPAHAAFLSPFFLCCVAFTSCKIASQRVWCEWPWEMFVCMLSLQDAVYV